MNEGPHSVSVAGVVVNDRGEVLLIQRRDNGHWEPPGGVLEFGESIRDGLRREVREETGLDVQPCPDGALRAAGAADDSTEGTPTSER